MKNKGKLIADLAAAVPEPMGYIRWRDGSEHEVRNPVDVKWPDHLKLMHVDQTMEAALEHAPKSESEAEKLRDELVGTVDGLRDLLVILIPSVTLKMWADATAFEIFLLAHSVRQALIDARKVDPDPMETSQPTTKETTPKT